MDIEEVKKETIYQSFEDLDMPGHNSKSKQKLEALNFDPKGLTILDVGCNTGYFPIRFVQQGANFVVGIDVDRDGGAGMDVIKLAKEYAKHYGVEDKTAFYIQDIFDMGLMTKFDAITCTSTFHYFREKQEEFFKLCMQLLNKDGLLIREGGLPEESERYSRGVDETPCRFPSEQELRKMARGYDVVFKGKSVDQKGDKIPRYVLHFKKK